MSRLMLTGLLALACGCASRGDVMHSAPATSTTASRIDSIIHAPPLHRTSWGILAVDLTTGNEIYRRNAEKLFIPASNMKLIVGATALAKLGMDYRYATNVLAAGRAGDTATSIIVVGSGDPTWSTRFHPVATAPLDSMAAQVARAGIRSAGRLVIDVSRFSDELVHSAWEVGDLPFQYAPPVDAVGMADGVFRFVVNGAARAGMPATGRLIGPVPQPVRVDVITDTAGARPRLTIDYTGRRDTVYISGAIGASAADTSTLAVTRPAHTVGRALADALRRAGVLVSDVLVIRDSAEAASIRAAASAVGTFVSPTMAEITTAMMRPSQNWMAEQMHKTLGAHFARGGTWRGGIDVERAFLYDDVRLDSGSVNIRDASGMAPQDLITPEAVVRLLRYARTQPWGPAFQEAQAAPGLQGSTLASRLRAHDGRIFAKTGSISNVNSLSGYILAADGRTFAFSILSNGAGLPSGTVRAAIDAVVMELVRSIDGRGR